MKREYDFSKGKRGAFVTVPLGKIASSSGWTLTCWTGSATK